MPTKTRNTESKNRLDAYEFHGFSFNSRTGKEAIGDCPYCGKENHFYVNAESGQHDCKVCGKSGNLYSFLQKIHGEARKATKKEDWEALSELRSRLPWQIFRQFKLAYDQDQDRWMLPVYNGTGSLADLRIWSETNDGKRRFFSTTTCSAHLFNASALQDAPQSATVYVCEGEWDVMALSFLLERNEVPPTSYVIVGVPGANTFKKEWIPLFKGRNVALLYDNDAEGGAGMDKVSGLLKGVASSLNRISWPTDSDQFPEKYDIRDYVCDRLKTPKRAWKDLQVLISAGTAEKPRKTLVRTSFESVIKDFKKVVHITKNSRDAFLVTLATAISVRIPGDNVWMFLVGPPGSGKSLSINSFYRCAPEHAMFLSKLSAQAFISGFRTSDGSDPSIMAQIDGKCLFIKDYTAIKGMPVSVQEELYGILRDAYDKHVRIVFGHGEVREYNDKSFSMVAGVTDVIHGDNRATLGERFLKFELLEADYDPTDHIRAAIDNVVNLIQGEELLQDSVHAYYNHLVSTINLEKLPSVPEWVKDRVTSIAQIASYLRAVVHRQTGGDLVHRPRPEIGSRLAKQLIKLGRCIAIVEGKKTIDQEVYRLMEKTAFDTVVGWSLEMIRALMLFLQKNPQGATVEDIRDILQVSKSFVSRKLHDLQELRIVMHTYAETGKKGRPAQLWKVNPAFMQLWKSAKLEITPKTRRPRLRKRSTTATRKRAKPTRRRVRRKK